MEEEEEMDETGEEIEDDEEGRSDDKTHECYRNVNLKEELCNLMF